MARRRKWGDAPKPPQGPNYSAAKDTINKMERAVIYRSVELDFTSRDVIDYLFPQEVLAPLRAAHKYTRSMDQGKYAYFVRHTGAGPFVFNINWHDNECLVPAEVAEMGVNDPRITGALARIREINADMDILRACVDKFTELKITAGCARYYWSGLPGLLPLTHPIHQVSGERYRDTALPHDLTDMLRKVGAIQAMALLADPEHNAYKDNTTINIKIAGNAHVDGPQYIPLV